MVSSRLKFIVLALGLQFFADAGVVQNASRGHMHQDYALGPTVQLEASKAGPENLRFTASNGAPFAVQSEGQFKLWLLASARIRISMPRSILWYSCVAERLLYEPEQLMNELAHFVREKIPDRIVHAKGSKCIRVTFHVSDLQ